MLLTEMFNPPIEGYQDTKNDNSKNDLYMFHHLSMKMLWRLIK